MSLPDLPLQAAIVAALKASSAVKAVVGDPARVYDRVPDGAAFPYIAYGASQTLPDFTVCAGPAETFITLDGWSRGVGKVEAKQLADAICTALAAPLTVTGFRVVVQEIEDVNVRADPDGLTTRATVSLRFETTPS